MKHLFLLFSFIPVLVLGLELENPQPIYPIAGQYKARITFATAQDDIHSIVLRGSFDVLVINNKYTLRVTEIKETHKNKEYLSFLTPAIQCIMFQYLKIQQKQPKYLLEDNQLKEISFKKVQLPASWIIEKLKINELS